MPTFRTFRVRRAACGAKRYDRRAAPVYGFDDTRIAGEVLDPS